MRIVNKYGINKHEQCFLMNDITFEPQHGKTKEMDVRPATTQTSPGIRPV